MSDTPSRFSLGLLALAAGLLGGVGGAALVASGLLPIGQAAREKAMHDYLVAHGEVLPEAMDALRARNAAEALAPIRGAVEQPFPGAVLGNPDGHKVLVEFMDFACGYCRASEADVAALTNGDRDVKVVLRQLPILTPESVVAAKWALAAAMQGKYAAFHHALYAGGRPDEAGIAAAAKAAGLDTARARQDAESQPVKEEIARNLEIARHLGFTGTPGWEARGAVLSGAQGYEGLRRAVVQ